VAWVHSLRVSMAAKQTDDGTLLTAIRQSVQASEERVLQRLTESEDRVTARLTNIEAQVGELRQETARLRPATEGVGHWKRAPCMAPTHG